MSDLTITAPSRVFREVQYGLLLAGLAVLVAVAFMGSLLVGPSGIGAQTILTSLLTGSQSESEAAAIIAREIRLPRALLGLLVGASLGLAGAALQGYLRNPLAEPGLIGVTSGASLGAVMTINSGLASVFALALPLGGLAGGLAAVLVVQTLAGLRGGPLTLILAGVAVTTFASALLALALNLSPNPFAALEIVYWMLGSLADRSMVHVAIAAPFILPGLALLLLLGRALDALTLGEDGAANLGVNLDLTRFLLVAGVALAVGGATAVAGAIGFVGLVVPHLLRPFVAQRPGRLLFASMLGGAALVLIADIAVRVLAPGSDLKLGVLTSLVGAPLFFYLVIKTRRSLI
jgi:iron complex transport system permease protein